MPDAASQDAPTELLLVTGRPGGETLSPMWSRYAAPGSPLRRFWSRPQTRNAVETGVAIFVGGVLVTGSEWLNRETSTWNAAGWVNHNASVLIVVGSLIALALARYATAQLRLRRARAACFTTGPVVAIPDLLGLLTGGCVLQGMAWGQVGSYSDSAEHVALFRPGGRFPGLRIPVHDDTQRTQLLKLLDERGIVRAE